MRTPSRVLIDDLECAGCGARRFRDPKEKKICANCRACLGGADYHGIIITGIWEADSNRIRPWIPKMTRMDNG